MIELKAGTSSAAPAPRMRRSSCFLWIVLIALGMERMRGSAAGLVEDQGAALLRFRDRVELDPYGALSGWKDYGAADHCSWIGVECSGRRVVSLNLRDLGLRGTLAPELAKLVHLKHLKLHRNYFYGTIPKEFAELRALEELNLEDNNLVGPIPSELYGMASLEILILGGNNFGGNTFPEHNEFNKNILEKVRLSSATNRYIRNTTRRRLIQLPNIDGLIPIIFGGSPPDASSSPSSSPAPSPAHLSSSPSPTPYMQPPSFSQGTSGQISEPKPPPLRPQNHPNRQPFLPKDAATKNHSSTWVIYVSMAGGASAFVALSAAVFCFCFRRNRIVTVRPLSSGLSGRMQKAPAAGGALALRRSEVEAACEGFSNVIGTLRDCTLYKGTLPSGVEIAVTSSMATPVNGWSKQLDTQFKKKLFALSQVDHNNFMRLLGFCEDEQPFARMMVFEYAPNGTLFEHLHIREAEHLDWTTRLRIVMGLAYCLEHLHQLKESLILRDLTSSTIYLTEDYAAKVSDLAFFQDGGSGDDSINPDASVEAPPPPLDRRAVVYKFGVVCLEILSGRRPFSEDYGLLVRWASSHLSGRRPLKDMVDPTLRSFREDQLGPLCEVIASCVAPNPRRRATMEDVASRLRAVTSIVPEAAVPKQSPLLWAELQLLSMEVS